MKKYLLILLLIISVGYVVYLQRGDTVDAKRILEQSILKKRTFSADVKDVFADNEKLNAYLLEEHSLPIVAVAFGFDKAGKAYEDVYGTALLAESTMLDGTGKYSRKELRDVMKEKGIKISIDANRDRLSFSFSYIKEFEQDAWEILKDVLYHSRFEKDDLDLTKNQLAAARRQQTENPSYHLKKLINTHFYDGHPYGREDIPSDEELARITADDLRAYLQSAMGKENLKVGISGDITPDGVRVFLENVFADLPERSSLFEMKPFDARFSADDATVGLPTSAQSFVLLATRGIKRLDKDFYPLYIADYVLGGSGLNSRLNKAVREDKGLTYGIYSYFSNSDAVDLWQIYFSATPEKAEQALRVLRDEYQKFYEQGIRAEELVQAKKALLSSFNLRFSSLFNMAEMLEQMQVQSLGKDFLVRRQSLVQNVLLNDVNRAIKEKMPKSLAAQSGVRLFEVTGERK